MDKPFAIYHTWPDMRNAEFEVLQRIIRAAQGIGKDIIVIDNAGKILWGSHGLCVKEGSSLNPDDVEFAISLHFESPRLCDVYTYYALWQPIKFYDDFGYQISVDKICGYNDFLSCHADLADSHALNIAAGSKREPLQPLPSLFHMLPEPYLSPRITDDVKLFYVGINWERIGRPKGRYHDLLVSLDRKDLIEIYGPEKMHGVAPWEGFKSYRGELPFDGSSIQSAINSAGACLALSSTAHKNTGVMSNRLFEGLTSGAAVIATPHPLIDKYFKDVVYVVDDSQGEIALGQQIESILRTIRLNPEEATRRVLSGQEILRNLCSLERSLSDLFERHSERRRHFEAQALTSAEVTVVAVLDDANENQVADLLADVSSQVGCTVDLHILIDSGAVSGLELEARNSLRSVTVHPFDFSTRPERFDGPRRDRERTGPAIDRILRTVATPYFAFVGAGERMFKEHFASLARAMQNCEDATFSVSGRIALSRDVKGYERRTLDGVRFTRFEDLLMARGEGEKGRFLFNSSLLTAERSALMQLMDGEEHRFFSLLASISGPLAQSGYATSLIDQTIAASVREPVESAELQQQYIRDAFVTNGRWIERLTRGGVMPQFVHATAPGSPIRWDVYRSLESIDRVVPIDRPLETRAGGDGVSLLVSGFSHPEAEATWLAAERGVILFTLPENSADHAEDFDIVLRISGRPSYKTGRVQHCTFVINGMTVAYSVIPAEFSDIRIRIPVAVARSSRTLRLEIIPDHSEVVINEMGVTVDSRALSVLLRSIAICREGNERLPKFELNQRLPVSQGEFSVRSLARGFYAPERNLAWISGLEGGLAFRIPKTEGQVSLCLHMVGRASREGVPQTVHLKINGRDEGSFPLGENETAIERPIPADYDVVRVDFRLAHAEPVYNELGEIIDNRMLGGALLAIGLKSEVSSRARTVPGERLPGGVWSAIRRSIKRS